MVRIPITIISRVAVPFSGFMCIRVRKLHAECKIQADIQDYRNCLGDRLELWPSIHLLYTQEIIAFSLH